jgi:DNA-binding response OmpR family regulator
MERPVSNRPLILVVDDDAGNRRLVRDTLDGAGYAVATVATGEAALARLAVTRPEALVLGMTMPRPDGWDVLRHLRDSDRPGDRIPVVACLERTIDRAKAFRYGADHYVLKPFAPEELRRRVEAVVPRPAALASRQTGEHRLRLIDETTPADEPSAIPSYRHG